MTTNRQHSNWIDGHLDLAYLAVNGRDLRLPCDDPSAACISLPDLRAGNVTLAFGTIFTAPQSPGDDGPETYRDSEDIKGAHEAGLKQLRIYEDLEAAGEITIVRSLADLDAVTSDNASALPGVVLLMEGADPIRSPDDVAFWHERGLRLVGLTWAMGTRYAGGNAAHGPLTDRGRDLVQALDAHGIIHDASHLADQSLDDLLKIATGPIVATHSNCRALMEPDNQRHLRDDQIKAITERANGHAGTIGLNLFTKFLARDRRSTVDDCIAHIEHITQVAGRRDCVALGSDMDGGFGPASLPTDVDQPQKLNAIADALAARGWSDEDIAGFRTANWLRVLHEAWADAPS